MKNSILFFFVANLMLLFYVDGIDEIPQEHQIMIHENPYRILGIGDACMDLLIPVEEEFLAHVPGEKGGSQPISPEELNKILAAAPTPPYIATGGSGANTIKGLAALNEKCAFLSLTGRDSLGEQFSNYLKKWGILGLFTKSHLSTTVVLCLITPDGQRTMRFSAGCSVELSDQLLHAGYFRNTDLIHLDAYTLRRDLLTERTIHLAKEAQANVSIDLSSFEIIREFHARILDLLPQIDIVFANEMEVKELTGLEPYEACFKLQELCPIAVVLLGKNGCLVGHQGIIFHSPGFPTEVVDTTGAGDLFASGFLYGYLKGYSLDHCARMGNRLGSAIIEVTGAELTPEKWESVKRELQEILHF
jgi:sugar/nucleoside kinase (ribokinase family)